jgi:hypothetical protein
MLIFFKDADLEHHVRIYTAELCFDWLSPIFNLSAPVTRACAELWLSLPENWAKTGFEIGAVRSKRVPNQPVEAALPSTGSQ